MVIAGNRVHSPEGLRYWNEEIKPHLSSADITYAGAVDDATKNKLLGQSSALLVPIEWEEPFGIVFAESLACGTPVISSPLGALPEIIENGKHGYLVTRLDQGVEAVKHLPAISRANCRQRAVESFFFAKCR